MNCSADLCECNERCMGTHDVCLGLNAPRIPSHFSLPDALNAVKGNAVILLDGKVVSNPDANSLTPAGNSSSNPRAGVAYRPGAVHHITIITSPGSGPTTKQAAAAAGTAAPVWVLIDAGVGAFSTLGAPDEAPANWRTQCSDTRASFAVGTSTPNLDASVAKNGTAVEMLWTAPPLDSAGGSRVVTLRVATATSKGNISVVAAVLTPATAEGAGAASVRNLAAGELGYACTMSQGSNRRNGSGIVELEWAVPQQQCQSVPPGTPGAMSKSQCTCSSMDLAVLPHAVRRLRALLIICILFDC